MNIKRKSLTVETRRVVIHRDNATCQVCGKTGDIVNRGGKPVVMDYPNERARLCDDGTKSISFHFHHKTPVFLGGSDDPENLELRCQKCNSHEKFTNMIQNYLKTLPDKKAVVLSNVGK